MKLKIEFINGVLIFIGVAIYFLIIELLGLSHIYFLRLANALFVIYGVRRTILWHISHSERDYLQNYISGYITSLIAVVLSVISLRIYCLARGGDSYVKEFSKMFWFGNNASLNDYCIGLLFEGAASSILVVFVLMNHYNSKFLAD
jgi:hypothetical protein